jgi:DNA-binding NtrC family response regulator
MENNKKVNDFTPDAFEALMSYAWPGNVRELRTAVESAVVLSRGERISLRDLPAAIREAEGGTGHAARLPAQADLIVAEAEKRLVIRALKECGGNRTLAAGKLGMSRRTLHRKLHLYHLEGI